MTRIALVSLMLILSIYFHCVQETQSFEQANKKDHLDMLYYQKKVIYIFFEFSAVISL